MSGPEDDTRRIDVPDDAGAPQPGVSWRLAAASWVGQVRHQNQDSAYTSPRLAAVADGMGGEAAGDLASMLAARRFWMTDQAPPPSMTLALIGAVAGADADIAELVRHDRSLTGMGTTMCAVMLDGHELAFVHIGDSRAYLWRDQQLTQLTHDHSLVQQLIDQGEITPAEARTHPKRSLVLRIVNGTPMSRPDHFTATPHIGDRYLVCSDGLSSYADADVIADALKLPDLGDVTDALLAGADAAGAPDNVTFVVAEITAADDALDAVAPKLWGAAAALTPPADVPDNAPFMRQLQMWGVRPPGEDAPGAEGEAAPGARRKAPRRRWPRRLIVALVVLAVLIGGALGGRAWLSSQYFLGVVDGKAAIFTGVPYKVGPWYLSTVQQTSDVNLADLPVYYADQVRDWTIRPDGMASAQQSLAQLAAKADACIAARNDPSQPSGDCP